MGFTVGQDQGSYDDADSGKEDKAPKEVYREDGSVTTAAERSDFSGTLDTTDVASGAHADLRNVSTAFDEADSNLARRLEEAGTGDQRTDDERTIERGPGDVSIIEGKGDRSEAEILESLDKGVPTQDPANPAEGEPGDGQAENAELLRDSAEERAERQEAADKAVADQAKQDAAAGFATDAEVAAAAKAGDDGRPSADEVVKGTVPEVEAHLKEYPEDADDVLAAEEALAKEEDREVRAGVEASVDKHRLFDPAKYNVGETKEHFDASDDAEVKRVQAIEAEGQARPGIMNWTRA